MEQIELIRFIDIVLDLQLAKVPQFTAAFSSDGFYCSEQAVRDAVRSRVQFNVLHPASANEIDFILTRPEPWNTNQLQRRRQVELRSGSSVFQASIGAPKM